MTLLPSLVQVNEVFTGISWHLNRILKDGIGMTALFIPKLPYIDFFFNSRVINLHAGEKSKVKFLYFLHLIVAKSIIFCL
jgi:hypothetical protein